MVMPGREYTGGEYKFGFNTIEYVNEINSYNTNFRLLNQRLCRWLSTDKLDNYYSYSSPYVSNGNSPIIASDIDGRRIIIRISGDVSLEYYNGKLYSLTMDGVRSNAPYRGSDVFAEQMLNNLALLKKSSTGLELVNYVQNRTEMIRITEVTGDRPTEASTEDPEPSILFNLTNDQTVNV
jgi:hypothetical protein